MLSGTWARFSRSRALEAALSSYGAFRAAGFATPLHNAFQKDILLCAFRRNQFALIEIGFTREPAFDARQIFFAQLAMAADSLIAQFLEQDVAGAAI